MAYRLTKRHIFTSFTLLICSLLFIGFQNFDYVEFVKIQNQEKDRVSAEVREIRGIASVLSDKEKQVGHQIESWVGFESDNDAEVESLRAKKAALNKDSSADTKDPKAMKTIQWQRLNRVNWNISDASRLSVEVDPNRGDEVTLSHAFSDKAGLKLRRAGQSDQTQVEFQMKW